MLHRSLQTSEADVKSFGALPKLSISQRMSRLKGNCEPSESPTRIPMTSVFHYSSFDTATLQP